MMAGLSLKVSKLGRLGRFVQFARSYGVPRAGIYFMNTTFFDLRTGLNTARSMPSKVAGVPPDLLGDSVDYLPSWTVTIRKAFRVVKQTLGAQALGSTFVDVGAGKGKVCIVWAQELRRARIASGDLLAVDISEVLCGVASENLAKAGLTGKVRIVIEDAAQLSLDEHPQILLWLYNPFGAETLSKLLRETYGRVVGIVYSNPVAHETVVSAGYELIYQEEGWHPNLSFTIYVPRNLRNPHSSAPLPLRH